MRKLAVLAASLGAMAAFADVTYYVSPGGDGSDGLTWATAFKHPQTAIDAADGTAPTTIIVAKGTYGTIEETIGDNVHYNVIHVNKSHVRIQSAGDRENTVLDGWKKGWSGIAERNSRAIMIDAGLEDVEVSGFTVTYGCTIYNKGFASSAIINSGVVSNCTIHTYWRGRNPMIRLAGTGQMKDCLIDGKERDSHSPNSSNNSTVRMDGTTLLENCTIRDIAWSAYNAGEHQAVYITSATATVRGCVITGNTYGQTGGTGANGSGIYASAGLIENCTVWGNTAYGKGGGIYIDGNGVTLRNCIIWGNTATVEGGGNDIFIVSGKTPTIECCDSSDLLADKTTGNLNGDPQFADAAGGDFAIATKSLCTGVGRVQEWMTDAKDLAGGARLVEGTVSVGALEPQERFSGITASIGTSTGEPTGRYPLTVGFVSTVGGAEEEDCTFVWDFGDGTTSTEADPEHTYETVGSYTVKLTVSKEGVDDAVDEKAGYVVSVGETCYVSTEGGDVAPYDTWAKAARSVEAAVALKPDDVVVSNGTYAIEGLEGLVLNQRIRVRSANGPDVTALDGGGASGHTIARIQAAGASLEGFSLVRGNGTALIMSAGSLVGCVLTNQSKCYRCVYNSLSGTAVATNCIFDATGLSFTDINLEGRVVEMSGSAALYGCQVRNLNLSYDSINVMTLAGVSLSGAAAVRNCLFSNIRFTTKDPDPTGRCAILVSGANATVENCTITGCSSAVKGGGGIRVTAAAPNNVRIRNTILHDCTSGEEPLHFTCTTAVAEFANNCLPKDEWPEGAAGCVSGDPCFADDGSGYRITKDSPCYNKGVQVKWASKKGKATDIDGQERHCGPIDIGCWELQRPLGLQVLVR